MGVIIILVGLAVRALFFLSLNNLNVQISENNREVGFGIIWTALIPFIDLLLFPYVVSKLSVGLYFELKSRNIPSNSEHPTKTIGLVYYAASLITNFFMVYLALTENRNAIIFILPFGLLTLVTFIIYWVQVSNYKNLLIKHTSLPTYHN